MMLLYADDIVFLATSDHELQKLISGFSEFCDLKGLIVNLTKTQVVVFTTERVAEQPIADITFKGSPVEQVEEYKYLCIVFHWKQGLREVAKP
eukprot:gene10502-biopygen7634